MECKEKKKSKQKEVLEIGIYPEWNVKVDCVVIDNPPFSIIGIYPEWNVKICPWLQGVFAACIGIYPEWNVKWNTSDLSMSDGLDWNISRMECKGFNAVCQSLKN